MHLQKFSSKVSKQWRLSVCFYRFYIESVQIHQPSIWEIFLRESAVKQISTLQNFFKYLFLEQSSIVVHIWFKKYFCNFFPGWHSLSIFFPDRKIGTPFCDFTNKSCIDRKNSTPVADLNCINFVDLIYFFIFQQSLIKICRLFLNYTAKDQNPYLCIYFMKYGHFFWSGHFAKKSS